MIDKLKIQGANVTYVLSTLNDVKQSRTTQMVNLCLMSLNGDQCLNLYNVYVINEIPVKRCNVDTSKFDHLNDLPIVRDISCVDLLIGQDNSEILMPLQVRKG